MDSKDFIKEVFDTINVKIKNVNDLVQLVYPLMKIVSKYNNLPGTTKKTLVLVCLKEFVDKSPNLSEDVKNTIKNSVDTILPPVIDQFYSLNKNKLKKVFSCCF